MFRGIHIKSFLLRYKNINKRGKAQFLYKLNFRISIYFFFLNSHDIETKNYIKIANLKEKTHTNSFEFVILTVSRHRNEL